MKLPALHLPVNSSSSNDRQASRKNHLEPRELVEWGKGCRITWDVDSAAKALCKRFNVNCQINLFHVIRPTPKREKKTSDRKVTWLAFSRCAELRRFICFTAHKNALMSTGPEWQRERRDGKVYFLWCGFPMGSITVEFRMIAKRRRLQINSVLWSVHEARHHRDECGIGSSVRCVIRKHQAE